MLRQKPDNLGTEAARRNRNGLYMAWNSGGRHLVRHSVHFDTLFGRLISKQIGTLNGKLCVNPFGGMHVELCLIFIEADRFFFCRCCPVR